MAVTKSNTGANVRTERDNSRITPSDPADMPAGIG